MLVPEGCAPLSPWLVVASLLSAKEENFITGQGEFLTNAMPHPPGANNSYAPYVVYIHFIPLFTDLVCGKKA